MDKIYIIESPSEEDLENARYEGNALFESLRLADCDVDHKLVKSRQELIDAFDFIIEDFCSRHDFFTSMPFIHISAHGDSDGIDLTNGDSFDWMDFKVEFEKINKRVGYVLLNKSYSNKISKICLCFSTCQGYNAIRIWDKENHCPFQCLVGPKVDIDWSDSLTGFITFYHLTNFKGRAFEEAVLQMNLSAGLIDEFDLYISPEVSLLLN